jgi:hypothetical protein
MPSKNGMKGKLDIVENIRVSKLRYRPLDDDVLPQVPGPQGVKSYKFDKGTEGTASCLFPVRSITKNGLGQCFLKSIY